MYIPSTRCLPTPKRPDLRIAAIGVFALTANAFGQTSITIAPETLRTIGGISELDRGRYFTHTETVLPPNNTNLGNLNTLIGSPDGPNVFSGRISTEFDQFLASNLPQDATRPGFIDPDALRTRIRGDYRNFVLSGSRYTGIRNNTSDAFIVNSGRFNAFWPSYFIEPGTDGLPRADAYAEFLNIYLDEVVYGPNAFYPVAPERFAIELVNEPDLHFNATLTRQGLSDWHTQVINAVHAVHPDATVGGPSLAVTSFEDNEFSGNDDFSRFEERLGRFIADRDQSGIGYYSFHPYERYDVRFNNTLVRQVNQSPGRVNGTLDLVRSRDLAENPGQDPLPISLTEYGSFNRLDGDPELAGYTRDEMQWDLARDIREQLLIYLDRPDVIFNATPFVQGKHFSNETPTPVNADNVFYEQDASGAFSETIIAQTFRAYANVSGDYIRLDNDNRENIQATAFRDGDQVYVLLNNLLDTAQTVDLSFLGGLSSLGGVQSATVDRVFQVGEDNFFLDDIDVTGNFQQLTLVPDEGAVLTLTFNEDDPFANLITENTFYSRDTIDPLTLPVGRSPVVELEAELGDAPVSALLRVTYNRPSSFTAGEGFALFVNGEEIAVVAGERGIDDGDFGLQSREIDVPLAILNDGTNSIELDFFGNGGFLASTALVVRSLVASALAGDFTGDGRVDQSDLNLVLSNWGLDVASNGVPNGWMNELPAGIIGQEQLNAVLSNWGSQAVPNLTSMSVPEPAAAFGLLGLGVCLLRRRLP